jgi:hypothetical protein
MLTTLANLKANYLNIDVLDTDRDATITACIEQAGEIMKTVCNQPLEQESVDFYFPGQAVTAPLATQLLGGSGYATKTIPYTTPVELSAVYRRSLPTDAWVVESGCVVFVADVQSQIYCSNGFGYNLYKAVLNVGYTTIPNDLVHAASELAVYIFNETNVSNESRAGLASKTITQNGVTTTRTYADILARLAPILSKYTVYAI